MEMEKLHQTGLDSFISNTSLIFKFFIALNLGHGEGHNIWTVLNI